MLQQVYTYYHFAKEGGGGDCRSVSITSQCTEHISWLVYLFCSTHIDLPHIPILLTSLCTFRSICRNFIHITSQCTEHISWLVYLFCSTHIDLPHTPIFSMFTFRSICTNFIGTRTMHVHDASCCAMPVHMCTLCMQVGHGAQERLRLNRT